MDQGEIIMEASGAEKAALTVEDLVARFRGLRNRELTSDRSLLS
jgi:ABC-type uncharacterized transport system ATPase component